MQLIIGPLFSPIEADKDKPAKIRVVAGDEVLLTEKKTKKDAKVIKRRESVTVTKDVFLRSAGEQSTLSVTGG